MQMIPCPLCGVMQSLGLGLRMDRVYWNDECACSDDHPCVAHQIDRDSRPSRPTDDEMKVRWQVQHDSQDARSQAKIDRFNPFAWWLVGGTDIFLASEFTPDPAHRDDWAPLYR
jgi:hypothetical protein